MNLTTLIITIAAIAFILTLAIGVLYRKHKSWFMTFLQNFTGVLFIISGYVKAVDPLGTAYKMEQYFAEFHDTFSHTFLSFLAPVFPWFSSFSTLFAIAMIIFEIVLGVMLLFGIKSKFTSWAFLLLVVFFTFLTGFTYLTGYVPQGGNFFSFGLWSDYDPLQMKVTDCGCFGDFLKLEPRISFYKDLALLIPAFIFIFRYKDMHQLFSPNARSMILGLVGVGLIVYCINNAYWNLPHTDFRPFKKGVNIRLQKELEEQAEASREVISYTLKNKLSGKFVELPYQQYLNEYKSYPKTDWEVVESKMTESEIPESKISDFVIYGPNDEDVTDQILENPEPFFFLVCHKLLHHGTKTLEMDVIDSLKIPVDTTIFKGDTMINYRTEIRNRKETKTTYAWDQAYLNRFTSVVVPFTKAAGVDGIKSIIVIGGADSKMINDFKEASGIDFVACSADDILLKTIVRSNPGVLLMQDGVILDKWHYRHLPSFEQVKINYIN
ncbi:MAG: DoxX family protein [Saprospiraceae bacterium]|nr:DoxX family protein [Saprospiraceae bacterium]